MDTAEFMKITDLKNLEKGDRLIIKPIDGLYDPLIRNEIQSIRVKFLGFAPSGESAILSRNNKVMSIPVQNIAVLCRYTPSLPFMR